MNTVNEAATTPLYQWHCDNGGRMVDFAGWSMPVQYTSIVEEHHATRKAIGMFDVSHMARFQFLGPEAGEFLDSLTTRRVNNVGTGKIRYSLVCNEQGGILDDVLVYQLPSSEGNDFYAMVVNASNREKIANWIIKHAGNRDIGFVDKTVETGMIAVQGPKAIEVVDAFCETKPSSLKYYTGAVTSICGHNGCVSRTGYTGEDGCEIICDADAVVEIWDTIFKAGQEHGARAAGLGARDTLRLEAAMPLYGHELNEDINPVQAGLGFAINLKDREFVGKSAIVGFKADENQLVRVGFELEGKRAAREGCQVILDGIEVGEITSGTTSPTLEKPISMGYVRREASEVGTKVEIINRGKSGNATVVGLPFYQRS